MFYNSNTCLQPVTAGPQKWELNFDFFALSRIVCRLWWIMSQIKPHWNLQAGVRMCPFQKGIKIQQSFGLNIKPKLDVPVSLWMFDVGVRGSVFIVNVKPALVIKFKSKAFPLDIKHAQLLTILDVPVLCVKPAEHLSTRLNMWYEDVLM